MFRAGDRFDPAVHERSADCQGMLRSLAWRIGRSIPAGVDVEDLISEGQVGLLQAARTYDPSRGAAFPTFAYWRIRGAMLDWVRAQPWYDDAEYHGGRLAERSVRAPSTGSEADEAPAVERVADPRAADPAQEASYNELREVVRGLIGGLGGRARQILEATLLDDKTLEEAGRMMGLHKGNVQRTQVKAFDQLAELLREKGVAELDGQELRQVVYRKGTAQR